MHHALGIQEILFNIFGHSDWPVDLASLVRTCRAFKDPALDVLWENLPNLSPLVSCLPEASDDLSPDKYSCEWDNLRSYTRRIRSIRDFRRGLDEKSFRILSNPPTAESLFPNLRSLYCKYKFESTHLLHLPLPSLISLGVDFKSPRWFQDSLVSFPESSPYIRNLFLIVGQSDIAFSRLVSNCICRWRNLQTVICPLIALDVDALMHLSCMPALTTLEFTLSVTLPASGSLTFSNLHELTVTCESLGPILRLLSWIRLPASVDFAVIIDSCPTKREFLPFLAGVQASNVGHPLKCLFLCQSSPQSNPVRSEALLLCSEDMQPCTAFSNLLHLELNIEWNVGPMDDELLALASAWPKLEQLRINDVWGWNSQSGITPGGLVRLLQTCRSLGRISLAIDTRGYTELPSSGSLASFGLKLPCQFCLDVVDSIIEAESIPAVATLLAGIVRCSHFLLYAWHSEKMVKTPGWEVYKERWDDVSRRAKLDAVNRRS